MTWQPDIVIYHANCADGFGAAWAAWMRWGSDVAYVPCGYGQTPPDVAGKHVLIGDFSFKRETLDALAQSAASIVILDHHKTAQTDLDAFQRFADKPERFTLPVVASMVEDLRRGDYPAILACFDMERSGARMVWEFCHPGVEVPRLIELIEDRDLWRFQFDETKPFGLWLRSEPFNFEAWELLSQELGDGRDGARIMAEARAMQRFFDQKVSELVGMAKFMTIGGVSVPVVNCPPAFASVVADALLGAHPDAQFAACYHDGRCGRAFSLRSEDARTDVSGVAKRYGGGGHRNAAGFGVPA